MEQEWQLDEGFLSEVNAQLRQGKEDGGKELEAMLQKVLQIYASAVLSNHSYAEKGLDDRRAYPSSTSAILSDKSYDFKHKRSSTKWNNDLSEAGKITPAL
ncbi:unnamed protein product [Ilex paraguariensis]|uniref:Uncharacterized protein n=1 Tax=Ilex paraguariensis TaxID=185542 RepID=A0ABC8U1K1_9AQUA